MSTPLHSLASVLSVADAAQVQQLEREGQFAAALALINGRLSGHANDIEALFMRGTAELRSGHFGDAEATFLKITQLRPELPEPYNNLGLVYVRQNKYIKARSYFEMAVRLKSDYEDAVENLSQIYLILALQTWEQKSNNTTVVDHHVDLQMQRIRQILGAN